QTENAIEVHRAVLGLSDARVGGGIPTGILCSDTSSCTLQRVSVRDAVENGIRVLKSNLGARDVSVADVMPSSTGQADGINVFAGSVELEHFELARCGRGAWASTSPVKLSTGIIDANRTGVVIQDLASFDENDLLDHVAFTGNGLNFFCPCG